MPAKFLIINKPAKKNLRKLPIHVHIRIINSFDEVRKNPLLGEKLHGELQKAYKFRIGDYRIVYEFEAKASLVTILKIEHRQGVYK